MLFDLLNRAQNAARRARVRNDGRENTRESTELGDMGASRIRNGISTLASMAGTAFDARMGEIPRIKPDSISKTDAYDEFQEFSNLAYSNPLDKITKISREQARDVIEGNKYRENQDIYHKFFEDKSIQPNNNFLVTFGWGDPTVERESLERDQVTALYGNMPQIEPWHVKSVTVNVLPTPIEVEKRFTFAFPSIDVKAMDHKFNITFQEDKIGTIFTFIQWAYSKIISPSGLHYSQSNNRIGWCRVSILNPYTKVMTEFLYQDVFIVSAGQLTLDYSSNGITEYQVEFQAASRIVRTVPIRRKSSDEESKDKEKSNNITVGTVNTGTDPLA